MWTKDQFCIHETIVTVSIRLRRKGTVVSIHLRSPVSTVTIGLGWMRCSVVILLRKETRSCIESDVCPGFDTHKHRIIARWFARRINRKGTVSGLYWYLLWLRSRWKGNRCSRAISLGGTGKRPATSVRGWHGHRWLGSCCFRTILRQYLLLSSRSWCHRTVLSWHFLQLLRSRCS
jgi:hypothetical protein